MGTRSSDEKSVDRATAADRRAGPRHPVQITIELTAGRELLILATGNLSGKGAFFQRAIPYAVGTRVGLRILLPGEKPITAQGEVVNIPNRQDFGMGVKFLEMAQADETAIERFAALHGQPID